MIQFDRALYLNLPDDPDRRERFERAVAELLWPLPEVERFEAARPMPWDVPHWWRERPGAWGCTLSHVAAWQQAIDDGCESLVVFEDDAVFGPDFSERTKTFLDAVPGDWQMIYFGGQFLHPQRYLPEPVSGDVLRIRRVGRTYGYAAKTDVLRRAIPYVLEENPRLRTQQIDNRLALFQETVNAYAPWQWLVGHGEGTSQINGLAHQTFWYDLQEDILRRLKVPCSSWSSGSSAAARIASRSESSKQSTPNPSSECETEGTTEPLTCSSETSGSPASEPSRSSPRQPTSSSDQES